MPDALYLACRPMLAVSGGRLLGMSAPFGTRGWWYEAWRSNQPWERYEVPAERCPRIAPAFLAEERRAMGDCWCIVLPLARTEDAARSNADPADVARWPYDQQMLQDDLWALALWLLPEAKRIWAELDAETGVIGREFEPWRALSAVVRLLERHGVTEFEGPIRSIMRAYQREKADLLVSDRTIMVIRALLVLVTDDTSDACDADDTSGTGLTLPSSKIAETVKKIAEADEQEADWASPTRVGWILKRLRLKQADRTAKRRGWILAASAIRGLARAYGLVSSSTDDPDDSEGRPNAENTESQTAPPEDSVTGDTTVTSVIDDIEAGGDDEDTIESRDEDEREQFEL